MARTLFAHDQHRNLGTPGQMARSGGSNDRRSARADARVRGCPSPTTKLAPHRKDDTVYIGIGTLILLILILILIF